MPLRPTPSLLAVRLQRSFHSSATRQKGSRNYYDVLQVAPTATPAEVKKSFYALSKAHHPDRNPSDPNASQRFVEISEAYATLRIPAKRQAYDRDHIHIHQPQTYPNRPQGSYSSSQSPVGGRPASGLSRRRTQFRGPPPSFYSSGGWGEHGAKRRAAQDSGAPGAEKPEFGENVHANSTAGGMGYGETPLGHGFDNDVPHFDRDAHFRTHQNQDRRRKRRGPGGEYIPSEGPGGVVANFLFVGIIVTVAAFAPAFMFN